MRKLIAMAACAAFVALPGFAMAQSSTDAPRASADKLKGPPNANGYGSTDDLHTTIPNSNADQPSASGMKGSPNANGFQKQ